MVPHKQHQTPDGANKPASKYCDANWYYWCVVMWVGVR